MENTLEKLTEQLEKLFGQTGLQLAFWQLRNNAETLKIDVNQFHAIISEGEKSGILHRDFEYNFTYTPRVIALCNGDLFYFLEDAPDFQPALDEVTKRGYQSVAEMWVHSADSFWGKFEAYADYLASVTEDVVNN